MQINKQIVKIRKASIDDLGPLVDLARKSFLQAFSANNKPENVISYLDKAFTKDQFSSELSEQGSTFYLAEVNQKVIGYTKINLVPAQTDIHDSESLEIARLYVLQEYIGLGLGKELLDKAFAFAREKELKYVWLGVWEHNPRAIGFYQKNGFEKFSTHPFPFGDEIQTDWLMKKMV